MPTKKTDNNPQTPGSPPRRKSNRTRGLEPGTVEPDTVDVSNLGFKNAKIQCGHRSTHKDRSTNAASHSACVCAAV